MRSLALFVLRTFLHLNFVKQQTKWKRFKKEQKSISKEQERSCAKVIKMLKLFMETFL